jgi:N,N'-diacetyllegionaminate synthase
VTSRRRVFVIAEAGVNHDGSLDVAKQLAHVACDAGADAVKFQTFRTELSITRHAKKAAYQREGTSDDESQFDMVKRLELSFDQFAELNQHCHDVGIEFMATPFDAPSVRFLDSLGMRVFKIASGEITNRPLLRVIGQLARPTYLSTGMSTLAEVQAALEVITDAGTPKQEIAVLHCNTAYPTPMRDVNLRVIAALREALDVEIGYSDHTLGIEVPIAAVACGASIIEKHVTLDKQRSGPDHAASLNPSELSAMVAAIRNIESALGVSHKRPTESELANLRIARKSLVAVKPIARGEIFSPANLGAKRPGTGISPMCWDEIIGQAACRDFAEDELIER